MPKVAQYGDPRARTQVVRPPRANAAAGSQVFEANKQAVQGAASLASSALDMKQRIDTTSAEEALVNFERDKNDLFFAPETGYMNTQGRNAYDQAGATSKALDDLKDKYGSKLGVNSRSMFDRAADAMITRGRADIARKSSAGLKDWEVSTTKARVENSIEDASLYYNQPDKLRLSHTVGRRSVIDAAKLEGIGAEATNERLQTFDSAYAKSAITTATTNNSSEGQALFDKMEGLLEGPDRLKMEKQITAKRQAEKLQSDSQQAILMGTKLVDQYDSREDIREQVNAIADPELRKKTMAESMRQFNLKKQATSEAQAASFEVGETHIIEGGSAETFQAQYPEDWQRLSASQKRSLVVGEPVITDWNVYSDIMMLPKEKLAQINPVDYYTDLAPAERKSVVGAVKSAKGIGSNTEKVDHQVGRTRNAQVTATLEQILGKKSKWNDNKRKQAAAFYDLLDGELKHRVGLKGGKLSSQEFTDMLSDMTRESTLERNLFGIDFLVPDVDQSVTDIPADDLKLASDYLRSKGIPVTSENLHKAYRQMEQ